jgi:hypothetical protein
MAGYRCSVFNSYSHKDKKFAEQLLTHLKPLERTIGVEAWSDVQIRPGDKWLEKIKTALAEAKVAVMLVTKDFLASDFIDQHELGPLLREAARGGTRVLWVPLRACSWNETPLKNYQAAIPPEKPLAEMKAERDRAWVNICDEVKRAVDQDASKEASDVRLNLSHDPASGLPLEVLVHLTASEDVIYKENEFAGTRGQHRSLEGFRLRFRPPLPALGMRYMAHLAGAGDSEWVDEGQYIGTRGEQGAVEGFAIKLTGPLAPKYTVSYMAHLAYIGDTTFCRDGGFCGTRGEARKLEGLLVRVQRR